MSSIIPIDGTGNKFPPDFPPAGDNQTGGQAERFGDVGARGWKVARIGITAGEVLANVTRLECIIESTHRRIQWLVLAPPGVTDYDVAVGRWLSAPASRFTKGIQIERFVVDETQTGIGTADFQTYQRNERDPVGLFITAVTGAATPWIDPDDGMLRPNNNGGVPPTGFVVLYRAATRE